MRLLVNILQVLNPKPSSPIFPLAENIPDGVDSLLISDSLLQVLLKLLLLLHQEVLKFLKLLNKNFPPFKGSLLNDDL